MRVNMQTSEEVIINRILKHLTPDLLAEKRFHEENLRNPLYGHCYHASQALWVMTGMVYQPMFGCRDWRQGTHWWLLTNRGILDITADQYYSIGHVPPYEHGKFVKWKLARRTVKLLNRVGYEFWS